MGGGVVADSEGTVAGGMPFLKLVVGGEHDACCGRALFERTTAGIPNARLVVFPGKGHMGIGPAVASTVPAFLDEHAA
jgi:hypothetical protein